MGISSTPSKVIVSGGGLGGLSVANTLQQVGMDVSVYERAAELKEMGAGIVLAANAMKALDKLGIGEQVRRIGSSVKKQKYELGMESFWLIYQFIYRQSDMGLTVI